MALTTECQGVNTCCPCNQLQIALQIAMPKLMFDKFFVGYAKLLKPQFMSFASPLALVSALIIHHILLDLIQ